ncbi:MAG: hypothetical protein DI538_09705 [Azospira oryzae]|jgi:hypothetical protein|nr:MAG: hypothetical protein DI538_09705 [Azospira oryzae]
MGFKCFMDILVKHSSFKNYMKIRIRGLSVDTNLLFRAEWKFPLPKIYLHERFEKFAKWTSRIIVGLGIGASLMALPTFLDFSVAILLLGVEVIIEKIVFEYSVLIVQSPPNFSVDEDQWITNGYLFPEPQYKQQYDLQNHFGPVYKDEGYGKQFFDYLKSWNTNDPDDADNNICLSFVVEEDNSYTTYIYANPDRKWLDAAFNQYRESVKYEKYGKVQQSMVMQMVYWKTLPNLKGTLFYSFTSVQERDKKFHFCPFYMVNEKPVAIDSHIITKYHYSFKKREEITDRDLEFYYGPTIKIDPDVKRSIPSNPQEEVNRLFRIDMETAINTAVSIEFALSENYEKSPPVIYIIFETASLASKAYGLFLRRFSSYKCSAEIRKDRKGLAIKIRETEELFAESKPLNYSKDNYENFKNSEQANNKIVLAFGFKDGGQPVIVHTDNPYIPFVITKCLFRGRLN